ncbi:MAG: c-type cytochrome [Dehalococcoidia bacterium]
MRLNVLLPDTGFRRFALLVALLLGTALMLAACGDGDDDGSDVGDIDETPTATEGTGGGETATATEDGGGGGDGDAVAQGEQLVTAQGCTSCHGAGISPAFDEIGAEATLEDGDTVDVDEAYLRESIVDPNAKVVEGYTAGLMPQTYEDSLSDEQIDAIVQYILSLN